MFDHGFRKTIGRHRRWLFRGWIALGAVFAAWLAIAAPLTETAHAHMWLAAVPVLVLMALMTITGLAWLVWLDTARRSNTHGHQHGHGHDGHGHDGHGHGHRHEHDHGGPHPTHT